MFLRELVDGRGPGRDLLIAAGVPILDRIEEFAKDEGYSFVRGHVPIRAALMQIISGMIVHSAAGNLRQPLWGDEKRLFFSSCEENSSRANSYAIKVKLSTIYEPMYQPCAMLRK